MVLQEARSFSRREDSHTSAGLFIIKEANSLYYGLRTDLVYQDFHFLYFHDQFILKFIREQLMIMSEQSDESLSLSTFANRGCQHRASSAQCEVCGSAVPTIQPLAMGPPLASCGTIDSLSRLTHNTH